MPIFKHVLITTAFLGLSVNVALAQEASASLSLGSSGSSADADASAPAAEAPKSEGFGTDANTWEFGLFWGAFFPSSKHELYKPNAAQPNQGHHLLETVTPDLGLRAGYFPLSFLGFEAELALLPSQTKDTNASVNLWALRAQAVLLAPTKTLVPFLVLGAGGLGVSSEPAVLGSDSDPAFHVGIGAKAYVRKNVAMRLDIRDTITSGFGTSGASMSWEALMGFVLVAGGDEALPPPPPPPADTDGDGIDDTRDVCKDQVGVAPVGCPPLDADADGVPDASDACPAVAGVTNEDFTKDGCPPPPADGDADGVPDASDACPKEAGDAANGCAADGDADGLRDRDDKCPKEAETKNGFEDTDGCPDELPEAVKKFTGVIEGIVFDASTATIKKASFPKLDEVVKVLSDFPALRMEISGHSDDSGQAALNTELSNDRADAVKAYFVSKGIADARIVALGAGSSKPIADNGTKAGRAKNRRIEFKVLE